MPSPTPNPKASNIKRQSLVCVVCVCVLCYIVSRMSPQDRVTPSPTPNCWRLRNIFLVGIIYGLYLTLTTWVLYHVSATTGQERRGWGAKQAVEGVPLILA